jgi:hypothetical protein
MQPTLETLRDTYEQFITHGGKRGAMSKQIKCMAVSLIEFYSHAQVANVLGVTDKTIYNWEKSLPRQSTPQFVELRSIPESPATMQLTLVLPQGLCLQIPYQSCEQVKQLITLLVKE